MEPVIETLHWGHHVALEIALDMARAVPTIVVTTRSPEESMSQRLVSDDTSVVAGFTRIGESPLAIAKLSWLSPVPTGSAATPKRSSVVGQLTAILVTDPEAIPKTPEENVDVAASSKLASKESASPTISNTTEYPLSRRSVPLAAKTPDVASTQGASEAVGPLHASSKT